MEPSDFRREYLCQHTSRPDDRPIDLAAWTAAPTADVDTSRMRFAIDASPNGDAACIAVAGLAYGDADRVAVEVIDHRPGVDWIVGRARELRDSWSSAFVVDGLGPVAWVIPALRQGGVRVVEARTSDVLAASAGFASAVSAGRVAHQADPRLAVAIDAARQRRSGDRWCFDRHVGVDVSPLIAASLAVWAVETRRGAVPAIH